MTLNRKQQGFTIVELIIVIVVIGILAALVITTFAGIQQRARNTERETDVKAIHGHLETYFADNGFYPTLANLQDNSWVDTNLPGLDVDALTAPNQTGNNIVASGGTTDNYVYAVTAAGGGACDNSTNDCADYALTATLEGGGTYSKDALN